MVRSLESTEEVNADRNDYTRYFLKLIFRMSKKPNMKLYNEGGYHLNQSNQISDFNTIDHAPHYSTSSRGGMQMEKTN